ncbi:FAD-dependent monooxygenase [Massilia sp. 9096]|uniref:FAD-dependent monooxygenase n=1 Tax=Massilia sp. 9096 TaxID=1500894 RepID=UPI00068971CA|nr:FAD-dependent monooxygenase [Massilia sp. 9096]
MTTPSHSPAHDVIVAGAGPVGLFLACELALAGCSVLILERAADPDSALKRLPFGMRGLSTPSIEALDRRGLLDELITSPRLQLPFSGTPAGARAQRGGHFAGIQFSDAEVDMASWPYRLPSSTAVQLMAEMAEMETVLARRAGQLGVEIRRGAGVTGVRQDADGVLVQAGAHWFAGRWLVGCDGGRSAVRKLAGFDFAGTEPEFTGYSVHADIADPDKLKPGRNLMPTGLYAQSQPGYLVMQDFDGGAGHGDAQALTRTRLQALLRRISQTGVTLGAIHAASTWTDRARQATHYRQGRILLAGDAAHIHSPLGGQGLNLGLGDAMNLGWKLAATLDGAALDLLDSYHLERHPIGARVLDWSRAQVALMRPTPDSRALRAVMQDLMQTRDGATYVAGRVWGMHTRLDLGGSHALTGRSMPNFAFPDGVTVDAAMRDGRGLLLDFSTTANVRYASVAAEYGARLRYLVGQVENRLGIGAALVRPDGIVAWAIGDAAGGDDPDGIDALRRAVARWFGVKGCGASVSLSRPRP